MIDFQSSCIPIYLPFPYRSSVVLAEELMDISLDDGGLPCAQLSNDQDLVQMFLLLASCSLWVIQ